MGRPNILVVITIVSILINTACQPDGQHHTAVDTTEKISAISDDTASEAVVDDKPYFKASGTEPFWGLTISNTSIRLSSINQYNDSFNAPHTEPINTSDANIKTYNLQNKTASLAIEISRAVCINEMSGDSSPYKVVITLVKKNRKDSTVFNGCGKYVTD